MDEEHRGTALVILGVVAVIAVIGLVLMFSTSKQGTGALFTTATGGKQVCPITTKIGEPQWFPVLAGPYENERFLQQWVSAGYECKPASAQGIDEYSYSTWCCREPLFGQKGINPQVLERGPIPLETRQGFGVPVGGDTPENYQYASNMKSKPRVGP